MVMIGVYPGKRKGEFLGERMEIPGVDFLIFIGIVYSQKKLNCKCCIKEGVALIKLLRLMKNQNGQFCSFNKFCCKTAFEQPLKKAPVFL